MPQKRQQNLTRKKFLPFYCECTEVTELGPDFTMTTLGAIENSFKRSGILKYY